MAEAGIGHSWISTRLAMPMYVLEYVVTSIGPGAGP